MHFNVISYSAWLIKAGFPDPVNVHGDFSLRSNNIARRHAIWSEQIEKHDDIPFGCVNWSKLSSFALFNSYVPWAT